MMIRSCLLWRASHSLAKSNLFQEIDGNLQKFKTSQVSEIAEFQEMIKEKGFTLEIGKKSANVTLRKQVNNFKIEIFTKALSPEVLNERAKLVLNPNKDKNLESIIEQESKAGSRFVPVPI